MNCFLSPCRQIGLVKALSNLGQEVIQGTFKENLNATTAQVYDKVYNLVSLDEDGSLLLLERGKETFQG